MRGLLISFWGTIAPLSTYHCLRVKLVEMIRFANLIFILLIQINLSAQTYHFGKGQIEYEESTIDAIKVTLDPSPKTTKNNLEDWMNENYDVNLDGKTLLFFDKEYMTAKGVLITEISDKKIDLYVKSEKNEESFTVLYVFSSFGYNSWINKQNHPQEFKNLKGIVDKFVSNYLPEYYANRLEDKRSTLEDLKEDRKDMEEEIVRNNEKIRSLRDENSKISRSLEELGQEIVSQEKEVSKAKMKVKNINNKIQK